MPAIKTRVRVGPDHSISGTAPDGVPVGDHEAVITLPETPVVKFFRAADLPSHSQPWDAGVSLRREDLYGDDGR